MKIVRLTAENRDPVDRYVKEEWSGPKIVTLGNIYDSSVLPGFAAMEGSEMIGALLYRPYGDECEIAVLYSRIENQGTGTSLINEVVATAKDAGYRRVWLVTTNDNTHAIRFYQKYGFSLKAVHIGAMEVTRNLKKGVPIHGIDGIPLLHEFEFELCF